MYLKTKEIAQKWNISETRVTVLCKQGRIKGVIRKGNRWLIPDDAEKPADGRKAKQKESTARLNSTPFVRQYYYL